LDFHHFTLPALTGAQERTMSKKNATKKQAEKKTTKSAPEPKAKANTVPARKVERPAYAKAKKEPAAPAQEAPVASAHPTPPKAAPTTTAAPATPQAPDARLPAPGTLLQKRDRHGALRCECTVEADGIRYAGKSYKSLSAAAMAAARDLGLTNKTQNGFVFWGLSKPPRKAGDPLVALERAWERYQGQVLALLKGGVTDDNRVEVAATIAGHVQAIENMRAKVA
jgi:hypothetical protein